MFLPIISAILQASSITIDKVVLSMKNLGYRTYMGISFPLIFIITLIIFLIFKPELSLGLLKGKYLFLILASVILGIITNIIFYKALKSERLNEIETIALLSNIPVILFAAIFFTNERNYMIVFLALLCSSAVIWSHWQRHHFQLAKKTVPLLIWTLVVSPIGAIISKNLLAVWNPISLELVRSGILAIIIGPLYLKYSRGTSAKAFWLLLLTNIFTAIAWILYYFSYQISGIIYTVLLFSLQPLLVYFASIFFLKEAFHWKKFAAFIIILASIIVAQLQ